MPLPPMMRISRKLDVQLKPWMSDYRFEMVTQKTLARVIDECIAAGIYGLDLETTSLDTRIFPREVEGKIIEEVVTDIVGVCLSPGGKVGYYIPLRHQSPNDSHNVPFTDFDREFRRLMASKARPVVANCKFEGEILSFPGGEPYGDWDDPQWWEDVQILGYLENSVRKQIGLKALSKEILGKEMIELEELFPPKTVRMNFGTLDPSDPAVLAYACGDAVCTIELHGELYPKAIELPSTDASGSHHSQGFVHLFEKLCVPSIRWMERARLYIDLELVATFIHKARKELLESLEELYRGASELLGRDITPLSFYLVQRELKTNPDWETLEIAEDPNAPTLRGLLDSCKEEAAVIRKRFLRGDFAILKECEENPRLRELLEREAPPPRAFGQGQVELQAEYDVMSSQQMGVLLFDLGIKGLQKTATGQIKTSKDVLDTVIDNNADDMPFMKKVKVFRGNDQALKNLVSIWRDTDRRDNSLKISFRAYAAGTGRFSSRGDKNPEATGGTKFNLQSMPAGKDPRSPEALLRIRECIAARPGKVMVVIDFSGVELRIVANVAREKKWIDQFFKCSSCELEFDRGDGKSTPPAPPKFCPNCGSDKIGDIHTLTAIQIYGEDAPSKPEWSVYRARGKNTNFALNYGGGPQAVQRQTGCTKPEAHRIVKKFKSSFTFLEKWQKGRERFAKKYGYVMTAFYRRFPLPDIDHPEKWVRAKALRNAINSPIQGASADITKMAMGMIYQLCKKRGWLDKVHMVLTMHDELVFEIDTDILEEAINIIVDNMVANRAVLGKKWPVPLTVDVELGTTWKAKYNLYEIQYSVALRRKLQQPGQTDEEIKRHLLCISGFYGGPGGVKKKLKSFEDIQWPELLRPHFEDGRKEKPFTREEKEALAYAWALYFGEDAPKPVVVEETETKSILEEAPQLVAPTEDASKMTETPKQEASPETKANGNGSPLTYRVDRLSVQSALKLAEVVHQCRGKGTRVLKIQDPQGNPLEGWCDEEVLVDTEEFTKLVRGKDV